MSKKWYQFWKRNTDDNGNDSHAGQSSYESGFGFFDQNMEVNNPSLAMKLATVYRCLEILSGSIASLPLQYKVKSDEVFQVVEEPTLSYLLLIKANDRQSSYDMWKNAVIQMRMFGNAYIYPRYVGMELYELILITTHSCSYNSMNNTYVINDSTNHVHGTFEAEEIIHLRNMSLDGGYIGMSTISYAARVLGITANADSRSLDSFKKGNTLNGILSGNGEAGIKGFGELQTDQLNTINDRVTKEINSGKKIISIPGQAAFHQLSMSATDLQLLDTRKFGVLEICRFFGVHPDKVFAGQSQNYKASAMSNEMFLTDTLHPLLRHIESELNAKLIPRELAFKHKVEYNVETLLTTSLEQEASYIEKTIQNGVYTPNHWRARKGQLPVEGGDDVMMSMNVAPINSDKFRSASKNLPPKDDNNTNK